MQPSGARILVIDDDEVDRMAVQRALRSYDPSLELSIACDVASGTAAIESGDFACVILDFHLPDGDGMSMLRALRARGQQVPVIVLTGHSDAELAVALMKAGATDYLPKAALSADRIGQALSYVQRIDETERRARRFAQQLQMLAESALRINASLAVGTTLEITAEAARRIVGVRHAHAELASDRANGDMAAPRSAASAPLLARDGRSIGMLHVGDSSEDSLTPSDQAIVTQLAQLASFAIDNAHLLETAQAATRARDDVMAIVSHDLRNPLHTIEMASTYLDLALSDYGAASPVRRQLGIVQRSAQRANRLIADLLDAGRMDAGTFSVSTTAVSTTQLLRDAEEMLGPLASEAGISLVVDAGANEQIMVDAPRVLQVFSNLGGNAIRFTRRGGTLTLSARAGDEGIRFSVADTGVGVAPEKLSSVFARNWQDPLTATQGAGLGLWISRGIVEAHGGHIEIMSELQRGTTVSFTLPR